MLRLAAFLLTAPCNTKYLNSDVHLFLERQMKNKTLYQNKTEDQPPAQDIYSKITSHIANAIEAGADNYQMPWHRPPGNGSPVNAKTGNEYRGVNVLALWEAEDRQNYTTNLWATYRQWNEIGAQVRRGEKGNAVVFYKEFERNEKKDQKGKKNYRKFARTSWVFNADQVDGYAPPGLPERNLVEIIDNVERTVATTGADIRNGGHKAYFVPKKNYIQMPAMKLFKETSDSSPTEGYYATLFHELTHWTGHESRLNRDLNHAKNEEKYAIEELVAELGAAFLCSRLQVTNTPRPNHAAYIADWLSGLNEDNRSLFNAAAQATKAVEYIVGKDDQPVDDRETYKDS